MSSHIHQWERPDWGMDEGYACSICGVTEAELDRMLGTGDISVAEQFTTEGEKPDA